MKQIKKTDIYLQMKVKNKTKNKKKKNVNFYILKILHLLFLLFLIINSWEKKLLHYLKYTNQEY